MTTVLDSPVGRAFRTAARDYCDAINRSAPTREWLDAIHLALARLYAAALALPMVQPDTEDDVDAPQMTGEEWMRLYERLCARLGRWSDYLEVYHSYDASDGEVGGGDLADDLADVYRDLSNSLRLEAAAASRANNVLFEWRLSFESHWARHAVCALRACHALLLEHKIDDPSPPASAAGGAPD